MIQHVDNFKVAVNKALQDFEKATNCRITLMHVNEHKITSGRKTTSSSAVNYVDYTSQEKVICKTSIR